MREREREKGKKLRKKDLEKIWVFNQELMTQFDRPTETQSTMQRTS